VAVVVTPRCKNPPRMAAGGFWAEEPTVKKTPYSTGPVNRKMRFLSTGGGGELMRMQNSYDIAQARRRAGQIKVARFRKVGDPGPALA
jgi:hypothetical protein